MNIFFSSNNHQEIIKLPIMPSDIKVKSPQKNETYTTINQGDIKIPGKRGLKSIDIKSFFPAQEYVFNRANDYKGWEYVDLFEDWRDREEPIRVILTNSSVNLLMTIDDFEYGLQDGTSDVYYSLSLTEFKDIKLKKKKVT